MKEHDNKLTLQETEELCRLYIDCRLTVFEETELQYVLSKLPYSSPCINETRMLMGISIPAASAKSPAKKLGLGNRRFAVGIAASVALLLAGGVALFNNNVATDSPHSGNEANVYIAAYSHGKALTGSEAIAVTNMAMAKADSLMKYASIIERDNIMKANNIITATINN